MPDALCFTDSHVHLQDARFDPDRDTVIARAQQAGVGRLFCNATRCADWPAVRDLARRHPAIVAFYGLHPWYAAQTPQGWLETLENFLADGCVGEIGLDRWISPRDEGAQEAVFRAQLALARRLGRPVAIHCVRAWDWLMTILNDMGPPPAGMLLHAYGGPADLIPPLAKLGAYFSFAGTTLAASRHKAREVFAACPAERLLIETDSPDLPPPARWVGRDVPQAHRNEPANLPRIAEGLAELRGMTAGELAERTTANAAAFVGGTSTRGPRT